MKCKGLQEDQDTTGKGRGSYDILAVGYVTLKKYKMIWNITRSSSRSFLYILELQDQQSSSLRDSRQTLPAYSTAPNDIQHICNTMNSFKVAIIGGSIAGLTTALHLEKLGIDWILLERRDEIAPQLGASIALAPNGLSILSQLGCFEDVDSKSFPMTDFTSRKSNGVVLNQFDTTDHIRSRFGFDIYITERKTAVESLYRQIQHKDKITSGQKIAKIDQTDNGVEIVAENDRRWTADIVVGADGVHSFTRKEMWRMASKEDPNIFPKDLEKREYLV